MNCWINETIQWSVAAAPRRNQRNEINQLVWFDGISFIEGWMSWVKAKEKLKVFILIEWGRMELLLSLCWMNGWVMAAAAAMAPPNEANAKRESNVGLWVEWSQPTWTELWNEWILIHEWSKPWIGCAEWNGSPSSNSCAASQRKTNQLSLHSSIQKRKNWWNEWRKFCFPAERGRNKNNERAGYGPEAPLRSRTPLHERKLSLRCVCFAFHFL